MRKRRGFTLLEVLVAVSLLAFSLTVILTAQTAEFGAVQHTQRLTSAVGLGRCKMNEVELELLERGYPLIDQSDSGPCCEDDGGSREANDGFSCEWKVETVTLPEPNDPDLGLGGEGDEGGGLGALGALAELQKGGPPSMDSLTSGGGIGGLSEIMGAASMGTQGIAPMLMGMVYPDLKPMLEASIRKVTVTVKWKEGKVDRKLDVTQYVTNPMQGGLDPNAAEGLEDLQDALPNLGLPGGSNPLNPQPPRRP